MTSLHLRPDDYDSCGGPEPDVLDEAIRRRSAHSDHASAACCGAAVPPSAPRAAGLCGALPDSPPFGGAPPCRGCAVNGLTYPRVARALHQVRRGRLRPCPMCGHRRSEHAVEGGSEVCSRGWGVRISCRACAEVHAYLPALWEPSRNPGLVALREVARKLSPWDTFVLAAGGAEPVGHRGVPDGSLALVGRCNGGGAR